MASPPHDASDEEWRGRAGAHGRYPVHDACEFEDAAALRRLLYAPPSSDASSSVSSDASTASSSSASSHSLHPESTKHPDSTAPLPAVEVPAPAAPSTQPAVDEEIATPPPLGPSAGLEFRHGSIPGLRSVERPVNAAPTVATHLGAGDPTNIDKNGEGGAAPSTRAVNDSQPVTNGSNDTSSDTLKMDEDSKREGDMASLEKLKHVADALKHVSPETPAAGTKEDVLRNNSNDTRMIKRTLSCPYDLDERDDDENTPLHIAIHARKIDNVRLLLEAGAAVHKVCDGSAPIHLAIGLGAIAAHVDFAASCVELLREYNVDTAARDDSCHTPLYLACASNLVPVVRLLLGDPPARATLNLRADRAGGRALHAAAKCDAVGRGATRGAACVTELLLAVEAVDVDARNNYGRTPLHVAAARGNWHAARLLIKAGACAKALDKRGLSPGQWARKRGMVVPGDLQALGTEAPTRNPIMDPDGNTLVLCHELCAQHRTCPPIVRGDAEAAEPPPENVRRLSVLINDDDGVLRGGEFGGCRWHTDARRAALADVLRVHEYPYVERTSKLCAATPDHPRAIQTLDADTTVSHWSFEAALRAAGSVCEAVDRVVAGDARNAFCAVRPPGHHAGPRGIVTCPNDPDGSHGFCLLNNIAIGASYARSMYRNDGIRKVAIIDFDVHHGNGTEEIIRQLTPVVEHSMIRTPFAVGGLHSQTYKPWLDESDIDEVFFASTHGYGPRDATLPPGVQRGWFYPASGATYESKSLAHPAEVDAPTGSDFLLSQTWARLGDDYRKNCCKIMDIGLSLPLKDDAYNHGLQRLELRDAYRLKVLPSLRDFDPDLIFISAGFDAHRRDTMNFGYVGMIEEDYEWLTEQLVKVANTCCNGRIVSALEGGYKIHGGIISPFARSVAGHVRALVDGGGSREGYDAEEGRWESAYERNLNEEKERKRRTRTERHARSPGGPRPPAAGGEAAVAAGGAAPAGGDGTARPGGPARDDNDGGADEPSRKRTRKQVDYQHLLQQIQREGR